MIDHQLTEEQKMLQTMAREFGAKEIAPLAKEIDQTCDFPSELIKKLGEHNFFGLIFPPEYGGIGAGYLSFVIAVEEIARISALLGMEVWDITFDGEGINLFGSEYLKRKYLAPLAEGKIISTIGFSEPETGVFAAGITTKAVLDGDYWVLNGTKRFQTNSPVCDFALIWARTSERGLSVFVVERENSPGWSNPRIEDVLGRRGTKTADCVLEDVRVPKENLLGEKDRGFPILLDITARVESPGIAAKSVGIAQAARALLYSVGRLIDQGITPRVEAAMAKLFASEVSNRVVTSSMIVHSGYGFTKDFTIERLYRDQKLSQLYGGTVDIQRMIIARGTLRI